MKKIFFSLICLIVSAVSVVQAASISDYQSRSYKGLYGDLGNGESFDISAEGVENPGDKIKRVKIYYTSSTIEGFEVEYLYGGVVKAGRTSGVNHDGTMNLAADEYITTWKFNKRKNGEIARIYLETNKGYRKKFGSGNWKKSLSSSLSCGDEGDCHYRTGVIGFYGTYNGSIKSIGVISNRVLKLEEQGTVFHDFVESTESASFVGESLGANTTPIDQDLGIWTTYNETNGSTDSWSNTFGITETIGVTSTAKVSAAGAAEFSQAWSFSFAVSVSDTVGKTESNTVSSSVTVKNNLVVPAYSIYAMKLVTYHAKGEQPYTTTFRNPYDGKEFDFDGKLEYSNYTRQFAQWLDVGYVDQETGAYVIYDEYQEDYGKYATSRSFGLSFATNTNDDYIDGLSLDLDDPNWVMSEEELAFRNANGLL